MGFLSEYRVVKRLLHQKHQVVFYAENRHYYQYFNKLILDLLEAGTPVCYITSDGDDPLLHDHPERMKVVCVKWQLGFLFSRIRASVMVMTMPDLGNYLFKRSPFVEEYIYMFHAAVSTHQQYRENAFFNYDTIFCTGEYQAREIRQAEKVYGLKEKKIISYGYPLLDEIRNSSTGKQNSPQTILVAPSWFDDCIFDTCIKKLVERLSELPYQVLLRPHPEYAKRKRKEFRQIRKFIEKSKSVSIDAEPGIIRRLETTDILITDRSGIAFEFAFGRRRPVLFIDTAFKVSNPEWEKLEIEPVENSLRAELGFSILPTQLDQLEPSLLQIKNTQQEFGSKMEKLQTTLFYNSHDSYRNGLEYVLDRVIKVNKLIS